MSPPPYITIPLHPLHTASTGLTFFPLDNVPTTIYHYSIVSTALCVHWFDLFAPKNNVSTTVYHYSTVSTAHCIHWFYLFAPKTMSPQSYTTIPLCTAYCIHCIFWFDLFEPKTKSPPPYTTILLHPLCTVSTV